MIFPPSILRVRIARPNTRVSLWLPLFLIWLPALLLAVLVTPVMVVMAALRLRKGQSKPMLMFLPRLFLLFCAVRGLEVAVETGQKSVLVSFK